MKKAKVTMEPPFGTEDVHCDEEDLDHDGTSDLRLRRMYMREERSKTR